MMLTEQRLPFRLYFCTVAAAGMRAGGALRCSPPLTTACRGGELPTADIHRSQGYTQYTQGQCQLFRKCARHRTGTPRRRAAVLQAAASTASSGMLIGRLFRAATCQGPSWAGTRANGVQKGRQGSFLAAFWREHKHYSRPLGEERLHGSGYTTKKPEVSMVGHLLPVDDCFLKVGF